MQNNNLSVGCFVATNDSYGIGKLSSIDNSECEVSFFINIQKQIVKKYNISSLEKVFLSPQTRVYLKDDTEKWKIGRVKDYDDATNPEMDYLIRFSNKKEDWYTTEELEVRCLLPMEDPTEVLAISGGESQFLYDSRKNVQKWLINLRASARGLTALTSSSIDLVVHQVNIVKKILTDPIQRYLLADEVGMGKTIEAGIIARQCLVDSETSHVLIIVPEHLLNKWKSEVEERFYFNDFEGRYEITSPERIKISDKVYDLVIVDEAHNLIGQTNNYDSLIRKNIIDIATRSEKLLLLSATPGIGNENVLLNLLKVLDPVIFANESLDEFKKKVLKQTEHGAFLRTLKTNQSTFLLKRNLPKVTDLFPNDFYADELKTKILNLLDEENREEEKLFLIKQLRTHLIETWRLHNRLIRTRRLDTEGWEFQERGKKENSKYIQNNVHYYEHPNKVIEQINLNIEAWRNFLSSQNFKERYIKLLEASNMDFDSLRQIVLEYKNEAINHEEIEYLENISSAISDYNYLEGIQTISLKIQDFLDSVDSNSFGVVFVSDSKLVKRYEEALQAIYGENLVSSFHNSDVDMSKLKIIVCDRNAEEGLDLQFADAIIHLDLPLNPSRIEQRIGRVDRYGRTKSRKIQHLILIPTLDESYPWFGWYKLLLNGFNVFHEPISDIQLKLESITSKLHEMLYMHGSIGFENYFDEDNNIAGLLVEQIASIIMSERESLDEQYALNHLSIMESDSLNIRDEIEDSEYDEKSLETDLEHWIFSVLYFKKWHIKDKIFEIKWNKNTLVPKQQFWSHNTSVFTDMWEGEFKASLDRPLTYYRKDAVENKEVSLLRPGHPLFDTLQHYLDWEDRGTVFSTFRVVDEKFPIFIPKNDIKIIFKLDFIVESGLPEELDTQYNQKRSLYLRRIDDYFPPRIFTLYVDEDLNLINDDEIKDVLDEPYVKSDQIDTNLSSRKSIIEHYIDSEALNQLCLNVHSRSKEIFSSSPEYINTIEEAISKAQTDINLKCVSLEHRSNIQREVYSINTSTEYDKIIEFEKSLLYGINNPKIKLDSFGMFFLSRFPLSELELNE